jgi:hypothetical protein
MGSSVRFPSREDNLGYKPLGLEKPEEEPPKIKEEEGTLKLAVKYFVHGLAFARATTIDESLDPQNGAHLESEIDLLDSIAPISR